MCAKICFAIITTTLLLVCTSCSSDIQSSSNQTVTKSNSSAMSSQGLNSIQSDFQSSKASSTLIENNNLYIKKEINKNLYIDAAVNKKYEEQQTLYTYAAKSFEFNPDKAQSTLLKNADIIKKGDFPEAKTYKTRAGSTLSIMQMGNLNYSTTNFFDTYYPVFHWQSDQWKNDDKYPQFTDLKFQPRQVMINRATDLLKQLGITNEQPTVIYSLDYKNMQKQQKTLDAQGRFTNPRTHKKDSLKENWSEKDDCYMMIFDSYVDGLPVSTYSHGLADDDTFVGGSSIEMLWSNHGVEFLNIMYNYCVTKKENKKNIISLDTAIRKVENKYDQIILNNPVTIKKISLMYLPIISDKSSNEFNLVPTWIFDVSQLANVPGSKGEERITNVFINAVSGAEII